MPVVVPHGIFHLVACPLKRRPVEVDTCYRCPFYIKRDGDFVYCKYEISRELRVVAVHVLSRQPVLVKTESGEVYKVSVSNPGGELVLRRIRDTTI